MPSRFEVSFDELAANLGAYVEEICESLQSEFLKMPRGQGFVEYSVFAQGYEALKRATNDFRTLAPETILPTILDVPIAFVVLRSILGFTPPEWAYVATQRAGIEVPQGAVRSLDRKIRLKPIARFTPGPATLTRLGALVSVACELIESGAEAITPGLIHRLDKADTRDGVKSLKPLADLGVPYAMLLYERFLGRPFAGHRDSVSELVGDVLEVAVESLLINSGISHRKTKRAERVAGFDQAPDFIVPDEFNPQIVIEAKITEDDGTARDKITRIQHLSSLSLSGVPAGAPPRFEVIACIGGRGFKVRREDLQKLLLATRGKVFTLRDLNRMVGATRLIHYRTKREESTA